MSQPNQSALERLREANKCHVCDGTGRLLHKSEEFGEDGFDACYRCEGTGHKIDPATIQAVIEEAETEAFLAGETLSELKEAWAIGHRLKIKDWQSKNGMKL